MAKKRKLNINTRFNKIIRIDEKQLQWLKENKICKTDAGFLDIIINKYKNENK